MRIKLNLISALSHFGSAGLEKILIPFSQAGAFRKTGNLMALIRDGQDSWSLYFEVPTPETF
jgi:hypothetical protein